jgi:hypothetical protein
MTKQFNADISSGSLRAACLDLDAAAAWTSAQPRGNAGFVEDSRAFSEFWRHSARLLARDRAG